MTNLSDGVDAIIGLLRKSRRFIDKKDKLYHPIYKLYYMVIYVAIQDAFDYPKLNVVSKKKYYKYESKYKRNRRNNQRECALKWLRSKECETMWENISDIGFDILKAAVSRTNELLLNEMPDFRDKRHKASLMISNRMKGLALL